MPGPAGAGGANRAVSSSPKLGQPPQVAQGGGGRDEPAQPSARWTNSTFRYSSRAARPAAAQSTQGSTRSLVSAPARAATATAPAPSQNQSQPDTSG